LNTVKLKIVIEDIQELTIRCLISHTTHNISLNYQSEDGVITFNEKNILAKTIKKNQFQFKKVMNSAIKGNITLGQTINCVFIENFYFLNNDDYSRYIRVDRSNNKLKITTNDIGSKRIHKIYADGSFVSKTGHSGYGGIIQEPNGNQEIFSQSFTTGSNNLMELLAVTKGLQLLKSVKKIQVNTDSRFVIRGLVQWIHFWKLNKWQTAYGCEVKFAKNWQQIDQLCEGKIIEFKWIKGHSGNEEQSFCHDLAKQSAIGS
jgi:ribonuclease HI